MVDTVYDPYTASLRERRGAAWHEYKRITDEAADENRALTPEETEQIERAEADMDAAIAEEKRHTDRLSIGAEVDSVRAAQAPAIEKAVKSAGVPSDYDTLRSIVLGDIDGATFETRALGDTPDGGSAVPETFSSIFTAYLRTLNPVLDVATVIETPGDNSTIKFPRLTADPAYGGTVTAEGAGIVAADATLSSVSLQTYEYPNITFVSSQLWNSNVIGLDRILADAASREIGIDFGAHLTTGTGTGQPNGFLTAATNAGTALGTAADQAGDTYFGPSDLIDLLGSLAVGYRQNASWMLGNAGVTKVRKIKDSNGNFLYNPLGAGVANGFQPVLLDRPIYENPAMPAPASANTAVAVGDFSRYFVRTLPISVASSTDFKFQNNQVALRTILEGDGDLIDVAAVAYLVSQAV
jgi:HK97 family phage major capsid protein